MFKEPASNGCLLTHLGLWIREKVLGTLLRHYRGRLVRVQVELQAFGNNFGERLNKTTVLCKDKAFVDYWQFFKLVPDVMLCIFAL